MDKQLKHNPDHEKLASFCRSLGNASRVAIVQTVARKSDCLTDEIPEVGFLAKTTIADHIRHLKKEGMLKGSISKGKACYCIDWEKLDEFKILFDRLYKEVKRHQKNISGKRDTCY